MRLWSPKEEKVKRCGWLYCENIAPFLYLISNWVGSEFTARDSAALDLGLQDSNADHGRWFATELTGKTTVSVRLAQQDHGEKISYEIDLSLELSERLDTSLEILQAYRLTEGNFSQSRIPVEAENYRRFIFDLVQACQELALEASSQCQKSKNEFSQGRLSAFNELIARLRAAAGEHHLDYAETGLDTLDPEEELTWD